MPSVLSQPIGLIVVIPACSESDIVRVLESLNRCDRSNIQFEVIVLINEGATVLQEDRQVNIRCYKEAMAYAQKIRDWTLHVIYIDEIPDKIAGVGTARRLAMDEAALRFGDIEKMYDGIIVNLDADCEVSTNYLIKIKDYFNRQPRTELISISFEHRIREIPTQKHRYAIRQYEAFLHYFIGMQRYIGLPYAFQTIGSAFAVRASSYLQVGRMNRRKAGEDFYFIHKFTKKGTIADLTTCRVYPSGRASDRVPFGTGRAVQDLLADTGIYYVYHPQPFLDLTMLIEGIKQLYVGEAQSLLKSLPDGLRLYLEGQDFIENIHKLRANAKQLATFEKAFYQWFDAFRLMKYLHFVRDAIYPDIPVYKAIEMSPISAMLAESLDLQSLRPPDPSTNPNGHIHLEHQNS